jgi:hypothetical protein
MSDIPFFTDVDRLLAALGEQLAAADAATEIVVVGGAALIAIGAIERATRDVDLLALREGERLLSANPLPAALVSARERVGRDFGLRGDWLNPGPTSLLDLGLPGGFIGRLQTRAYGDALTVHFASRFDQIHFKLYALVHQGPGRHETDLRALSPSSEELLGAARWTRTHDPSPAFRVSLEGVLRHLGVDGGDLDA